MTKGEKLYLKIKDGNTERTIATFSLSDFNKNYNYFSNDKSLLIRGEDSKDDNEAFGVLEKTLNENYKVTSLGEEGTIYNNEFEAIIEDGYVKKIWLIEDSLESIDKLIEVAEKIIPSDAKFIREYKKNDVENYRLYNSEKLKNAFSENEFVGGESGDFIVMYGLFYQLIPLSPTNS